MHPIRSAWPIVASGFVALALYLALPSTEFHGDGLAMADWVGRLADRPWREFVSEMEPFHLGFDLPLYAAAKGLTAVGAEGSLYRSLSTLNSVVCAIGVGLFAWIALMLSGSRPAALVSAIGLTASGGYWMYANNLEDVNASLVFALAAIATGLRAERRQVASGGWYAASGALSGLTVLAQASTGVVIPFVLVLVVGRRRWLRSASVYLAATAVTIGAVFAGAATAGGWFATDAATDQWVHQHLTGYDAATAIAHPGAFAENLGRMAVWQPSAWAVVGGVLALCVLVASITAAARTRGSDRSPRRVLVAAAVWAAATALFAASWLAGDPEFLVPLVPVFWIVVAAGLGSARWRTALGWAAGGLAVYLLAANLALTAIPAADPKNNPYIGMSEQVAAVVTPRDRVLIDWIDWMYWYVGMVQGRDVISAGEWPAATVDTREDILAELEKNAREVRRAGGHLYLAMTGIPSVEGGPAAPDDALHAAAADLLERYRYEVVMKVAGDSLVRVGDAMVGPPSDSEN